MLPASPPITPEIVLAAYACGAFPMAPSAQSEDIDWFEPRRRGILPIDRFHVSRSLRRTIRREPFSIRVDTAFTDIVRGCAAAAPGRENTWISQRIIALYTALHEKGCAHSVETWQNQSLVGGVYGVALGGAFFAESMYSLAPDASKIALVALAALLSAGGFHLLDVQYVTPHLARFGAIDVSRNDYRRLLAAAIAVPARLAGECPLSLVEAFLQSTSQRS